jgi:molybdopterin converting factor small subunit
MRTSYVRSDVAKLLLLGPAREAAGTRHDEVDADTLETALVEAATRYGPAFKAILEVSQVWVNGSPAQRDAHVGPNDEIAVLPPVSGG